MSDLKTTLQTVFNRASLCMYGANEAMQRLNGLGIHVYKHIPEGTFIRNYASDLGGAAALAWVTDSMIQRYTPSWMPMERQIRAASTEISVAASAAALTAWQTILRSQMDMGNMKCFAAALVCYYLLNKQRPEKPATTPAPK